MAADDVPLELARRAILARPERLRMCISAERSTFRRRKYDEGPMEFPLHDGPEEDAGGDAAEEGESGD